MNQVFTDTSFYAAIVNRRDQLHARARQIAAEIAAPILTTEFVLVETANFCKEGRRRAVFLRLIARLRGAANIEIVQASSLLFENGLDLFAQRPDKDWSLTDCISLHVMRERGLTEALTADHNFEQAGFRALLG